MTHWARCNMRWVGFSRSAQLLMSFSVGLAVHPAHSQLIQKPVAEMSFEGTGSLAQTRRLMYNYAACVVKTTGKRQIAEYLQAEPESPQAIKRMKGLTSSECLGSGQLQFNEWVFRAGVYDAMYARDYAHTSLNLASLIIQPTLASAVGQQVQPADMNPNLRIADCAVRKLPEQARALVLSRVATQSETNAFQQMVPAFRGCIYQDQQVRFSVVAFRGYVAEALYRLASSASVKN